MKKTIIIIIILSVASLIFYLLFNKADDSSINISIPSVSEKNKTYNKEISSVILDLEKIPEDFSIHKRGPRTVSDVSDEGIEWEWKEGYEISYLNGDEDDGTMIDINVSRYPLEKVSKTVTVGSEIERIDEDNGLIVEYLADPKIGERSEVIRVIDEIYGYRGYYVKFYKKDIYVALGIYGSATDYELLIDIAEEIEDRI